MDKSALERLRKYEETLTRRIEHLTKRINSWEYVWHDLSRGEESELRAYRSTRRAFNKLFPEITPNK